MALQLKKKPSKKAAANDEPVKLSKKVQAEMDKPFAPKLPLVNLLSPSVQEIVEQQRIKRLFVVLGIAALGLIAAVFALQAGLIAVAQDKLDEEQAKASTLAQQQATLAPVQIFYTQVEANASTIQSTMSKEVLTSEVLAGLNRVTPAGVSISSTSVAFDAGGGGGVTADPTATAGSCPSQDPYSPATISAGCLTVDGTATSRQQLGEWLDAIEAEDLFTVAFIPSTSSGAEGGGVSFSATVGLNAEAVYQNRYANPEFLKAGKK